ncbi:mitochondrial ribonuclease P catalytic subunit isoform X2 [Orussus abietinus]|nr:mitochondrial ribonuclease P catalytic subunit isoform X2 [Orussus abietinus]
MREKLYKADNFINDDNIDSLIISVCNNQKKPDVALSYVKFLRNNNHNMNLATLRNYLKILIAVSDTITEEDKREIVSTYDEILKKSTVLDERSLSTCLQALCLTERWHEAEKLLKDLPSDTYHGREYSSLACAAFLNSEPEIGWKYFNECLKVGKVNSRVYTAYLTYCTENLKDKEQLGRELLKTISHWEKYDIVPPLVTVKQFIKCFEQLDWSATFTSINASGKCEHCKYKLNSPHLSLKEFKNLSEQIMNNIICGGNVFLRSNVGEPDKFKKFVASSKPYDIVIDGLNVAGNIKQQYKTNLKAQMVMEAVRFFKNQGKTVLVLGRRHMSRWSKQHMDYIRKNAYLFLADDFSHDDAYLLYATIVNGPNTYFLSNDLMRQYKALLSDDVRNLFKNWQLLHQYKVNSLTRPGYVNIMNPGKYLKKVYQSDDCYHIPFRLDDKYLVQDDYEIEENAWLCVRTRGAMKSQLRVADNKMP